MSCAGESRYAPLLPGVLSARTYLKRANARVQNALERWAEPLSTWAWMLGERYPAGALQYAWKVLLQNHPHDSICGCSIDEVHDENMSRFARAGQVADDLIERASTAIARRVPAAADGAVRVVFFNASGFEHDGVVEGTVDLAFGNAEPHRHVDPEALDAPVVFHDPKATLVSAALPDGTPVPLQVLDVTEVVSWVKSRYETPWALHARRVRFAALMELPACGYASLDLAVGQTPAAGDGDVRVNGRSLENDCVRISVEDDGTATLVDKRTGKVYERCGDLLDEGDVGDEYNYSPPAADRTITSRDLRNVTVEPGLAGGLRGSLVVRGTLPVPAAATADRSGRTTEEADLGGHHPHHARRGVHTRDVACGGRQPLEGSPPASVVPVGPCRRRGGAVGHGLRYDLAADAARTTRHDSHRGTGDVGADAVVRRLRARPAARRSTWTA